MNTHTARARAIAQRDYLNFVHASNSREFSGWLQDMQIRGLSSNTIRQRISLVRSSLGIDSPPNLPPRHSVRESKWLDLEQAKALLTVIPRHARGERDFALIATLLVTGLRLEKVRCLRWSDLYTQGRLDTFRIKVLTDVYRQAFQGTGTETHFINVSPRIGCRADDYLFSGSTRHCRPDQLRRNNQPISPQEINRRIARYARLAGMESQGVTAECLRRTQREHGERVILVLVQGVLAMRTASPVRWKGIERDKRLHGIGRRSRRR